MKMVRVYCLFDLENPFHIRYVGQCTYDVVIRFKDHLKAARKHKRNQWVYNWIRSVDYKIGYRILEEDAVWNESEIKWIAKLKSQGHKLTNMTDGGDGFKPGYVPTEQHRLNNSKSKLGKKHSLERRRINAISQTGKKLSRETIYKMSKARKGRKYSKEHCKAVSLGVKKYYEQKRSLLNA